MDARILQGTAGAVRTGEVHETFAPVHLKLGIPPEGITENPIPSYAHTDAVDPGGRNGKQDPAAASGSAAAGGAQLCPAVA